MDRADLPLAITHAEMNTAYDTGAAVPLTREVSWLTRYLDAWWVVYERGWLRITDELTAADIDDRAARITEVANDSTTVRKDTLCQRHPC
jgi:hypothetical protein